MVETMRLHSPNEQGNRISNFLSHQRTAVISTTDAPGVSALPVWYRRLPENARSPGLEVDCLVPRWADVAHRLADTSEVVLIVQATSGAGLRWLQIKGTARPVEAPDWSRLLPRWVNATQPDSLYLVIRVKPSRIDLVDEDLGWGVQETLEW
jgi:hypothetical protein